ncbi:MAG: phosphotransferase family protein [Candidatus Hodarchaeota archaeon]
MEENSAAEQIRRKQRIKQILAEIVENLKDYFDELQLQEFGEKSRFVVLNRISSIHKVGSKGLKLVTADFNSELGSLTLKIAIKKFTTPEEAMQNKLLTNRLASKLKDTGVLTPRVIFEHGTILIYEGIKGESFHDSELNSEVKLLLTGEALSKFHSGIIRPIEKERYVFLLRKTLRDLIIPEERKTEFINLASKLLAKVLSSNGHSGGTTGFGDFHPGNVLFSIEKDGNGTKKIQTWLIDPEYVEEEQSADRMEDVGTFFLHSAIDNYYKHGNLKIFQTEVQPFIEGYERYLSSVGLSINDIYENYQSTLSFHLGLNALLEGLFLQKRVNMDDARTFDRMATCIALANYCWKSGLR